MDTKPPVDRSLFIPMFIGIISVLGICLVLLATRLSSARGSVQRAETETPVKYQYIGTEPEIVFPTEAATLPPATIAPTEDIFFSTFTAPTIISPTISTSVIEPISTNTLASITATLQSLNVTFDDADFKFLYTGNWISQSNVSGTYHNTLHVSSTIGNSVQLSFVGQKIRITYQAGPSLGTIAIKLDSVDFALDQSASETINSQWESPALVLSSHTITVTHISGGSINIDAIAVVDISTPTPTPTPTPTLTVTQ